ncbi:DUF362 domain-containing protein [Candidatus Hydrogenedentota bacterium]
MQLTDAPRREKPFVAVRKGPDAALITREVLEALDLSSLAGRRVLVKPNAGRQVASKQGITTNPDVVGAVFDFVLGLAPARIAVGDSPIVGVKSLEALEISGIASEARRRDIETLDLDARRPVELKIPGARLLESIKLVAEWEDFDYVISVPVMKMHMHTVVTLGLKNMKGVIWRKEKVRLHQLQGPPPTVKNDKELDIAIADLLRIVRPQLSVVDGTIGSEGLGPGAGTPKDFGVVVAGADPLATDVVSSRLMGVDAADVPHLRLDAKNGFGTINLDEIDVDPPEFRKWEDSFLPPPTDISLEFPCVSIYDCESCSACLSTVSLFLKRYHDELEGLLPPGEKLGIALGKGNSEVPEGTILVGNCTAKLKRLGIYVKGCPPVASDIWSKLHEGLEKSGKRNDD